MNKEALYEILVGKIQEICEIEQEMLEACELFNKDNPEEALMAQVTIIVGDESSMLDVEVETLH